MGRRDTYGTRALSITPLRFSLPAFSIVFSKGRKYGLEEVKSHTGKDILKPFLLVSTKILRRVFDWPVKIKCPPWTNQP